MKRTSEKDREKIARLYRQGEAGTEIADRLGVHFTTVYRILRESGAEVRARGRGRAFNTPEAVREVVRLYEIGQTSVSLGERFGTAPGTVTAVLHAEGVRVRKRGSSSGLRPKTLEKAREAAELRSQGMFLREIGERLGVTKERARQLVGIGRENSA